MIFLLILFTPLLTTAVTLRLQRIETMSTDFAPKAYTPFASILATLIRTVYIVARYENPISWNLVRGKRNTAADMEGKQCPARCQLMAAELNLLFLIVSYRSLLRPGFAQ